MKFFGWSEDREVRALVTGAGLVETRKGDFVMVIVARRWEDAAEAFRQYEALTKPDNGDT